MKTINYDLKSQNQVKSSLLWHNHVPSAVKVTVYSGVSFWPVNLLGFRRRPDSRKCSALVAGWCHAGAPAWRCLTTTRSELTGAHGRAW